MNLKLNSPSFLKKVALCFMLASTATGIAQIDTHEVGDMGYLCTPMESANGIIATNNRYSEIYVLKNNELTPILKANNCGLYTNLSKDGRLLGFKSFNENDEQAPAVLDVTSGMVMLLEDYIHQCGQPSFADDGTIAYTMGNNLIIRNGESRKVFDLGFYTNIANISPDGSQVAYSNIDGRMFIINTATGAKENVDIVDGYQAIWSPDGSKIAVHTANGTLAVQERASKKIHDLGVGESATWANNSEELIFTRIERVNDMEVSGSSIRKINFDGSNEITIVTASDNMPTDAIITTDNKLLVSYRTGLKRGLMKKSLIDGITPMTASIKEEVVYNIAEDDIFGSRLANPCDNPNVKPAITTSAFQQKIGANDIPYLSQVYDSPSIGGCTRYGYVTCAPTSACMYLGYYGLLNKKATTSRYDGSTKYYAYAIGNTFTNQAGTYTFNLGRYKYCATIYGAYGYMWNTGSPQSHIEDFMKLNGCTSTSKTYTASTAWSRFQTESDAGRPYLLCGYWGSSGHVVLGFATNCKYRSASGFSQQTGSFVCHDPYGDYNDSSWADGDGYHSTYDWVGYNNGQGNIGSHAWSVKVIPPTSSVPKDPCITASTYNVNLSCAVGKTATAEVTLDGYLLNKWTTVTVNDNGTGYFKVSPEGLNVSGYTHNFDPTNPKITITFSPDKVGSWGGDVNGDGFTDYYVTLHSVDTEGKDVYQWIALNGTALEPKITASTYVVKLNCAVGETASAEVTLDGQLLNKWTTVKVTDNNTGYFKVSPEGLNVSGYTHNFDPVNPKITITFAPKDSGFYGGDIDGDGYRDYFVTLQTVGTNGEDVYQWIGIEGTAYENSAPYIKADEYFPNFECLVGDTISQDFVLDGYSLNKWTTVEVSDAAKGIFSVTPNGLNVSGYTHDFDPKNPVITVKFHPDKEGSWDGDIDNDGYNDFFVRLHSVDTEGKDVYSWIMLKGKATKPYISVSDYKPVFECEVGDTVTTEIALDGYALNSWTTIELTNNCKNVFSISPTGLDVNETTHNFAPENPVLTIRFTPKEAGTWGGDIDGDGYQDYFITLHSVDVLGKDVYQWIILNGTATANSTHIGSIKSNSMFSIKVEGTELTVSGISPKRIELLASNGAVVADCDNSTSLNIKHLSAGIYIAKIHTAEGDIIMHKILIK